MRITTGGHAPAGRLKRLAAEGIGEFLMIERIDGIQSGRLRRCMIVSKHGTPAQ